MLAQSGSRQVDIVGLNDKREITVLLSVLSAGQLLPPQVIYMEKTNLYHLTITIPHGWYVTYLDNHWSTVVTMLQFVEKVLGPHMARKREYLSLPNDAFGLCICDVFGQYQAS